MAPPIRPIKTEEDYKAALERIDALMDAEEGSNCSFALYEMVRCDRNSKQISHD